MSRAKTAKRRGVKRLAGTTLDVPRTKAEFGAQRVELLSRHRYFEYLKAYVASRTGGEVRIARETRVEPEITPLGVVASETEIACAQAIALGASHGTVADQSPWRRALLDAVREGFR